MVVLQHHRESFAPMRHPKTERAPTEPDSFRYRGSKNFIAPSAPSSVELLQSLPGVTCPTASLTRGMRLYQRSHAVLGSDDGNSIPTATAM